jgi:hypothetical protein
VWFNRDGGIYEIRQLYSFLHKEGFDILDHLASKGMDYSNVKDFRDKKDLSDQIVNHDLELIRKSDVLVVLSNKSSYGTGIEMFVANTNTICKRRTTNTVANNLSNHYDS